MKRVVTIVFSMIAAGCGPKNEATHPGDFYCTGKEQDKVQAETEWCTNKTSYLSSACLMQSMRRNCLDIISGNHYKYKFGRKEELTHEQR